MGPGLLGHGFDRQRRGGFRLRWGGADAYPGSACARCGRATSAYRYAAVDRYSDPYDYRVADACRYAAGNLNNDAFPYAPCSHLDASADAHTNEHADASADADAGPHAHAYTDLAFDDL